MHEELEDILGTILRSGTQVQNNGNKTNTDDLDTNAQDLIAQVDKTVTTVEEIKTEILNDLEAQGAINENVNKTLDDLNAKQTNLEMENRSIEIKIAGLHPELPFTCFIIDLPDF